MRSDEELRLIAAYGLCPRCGGVREPFTRMRVDEDRNVHLERGLTCACETDGGPE